MIIYRHIRRKSCDFFDTKEYTIAAELRDGAYYIGIATCSPRDTYCKKTGREIARSRLKSSEQKITLDDLKLEVDISECNIFTHEYTSNFIGSLSIEDFSIHHVLSLAHDTFIDNNSSVL